MRKIPEARPLVPCIERVSIAQGQSLRAETNLLTRAPCEIVRRKICSPPFLLVFVHAGDVFLQMQDPVTYPYPFFDAISNVLEAEKIRRKVRPELP